MVAASTAFVTAGREENLPPVLIKLNKHHVPKNLLLIQAVIVSILSFIFLLMPTVNSAYWILMVLTTQLYLLMYLLLFSAAIKLRIKHPEKKSVFTIPGGSPAFWGLGLLGFFSSAFAFFICFIPPKQIHSGSKGAYVAFLVFAVTFFTLLPILFLRRKRMVAITSTS